MQLDVEKDPFLILLTDALRAGPGSPQWHEAVGRLKESGEKVDEYKLLVDAREALESGKDYRSVRAGPGFTRKLMGDLEGEPPPAAVKPRIGLAGVIALLSGLVILVVVGITIYGLYPRPQVDQMNKAIEELASTYFPSELVSTSFDSGVPTIFRTIGSLSLDTSGGLRPGSESPPEGGYIGGGIVTANALPADQGLDMQVTLRGGKGDDMIPQIFVSNSADFSPDRAVSSGEELVWQLQGPLEKVVAAGRVENQATLADTARPRTIRILLKSDLAVIEDDKRRLWAGPSGLGTKPRYLGIRFIRTNGKLHGDVSVQSIRILKATQ